MATLAPEGRRGRASANKASRSVLASTAGPELLEGGSAHLLGGHVALGWGDERGQHEELGAGMSVIYPGAQSSRGVGSNRRIEHGGDSAGEVGAKLEFLLGLDGGGVVAAQDASWDGLYVGRGC